MPSPVFLHPLPCPCVGEQLTARPVWCADVIGLINDDVIHAKPLTDDGDYGVVKWSNVDGTVELAEPTAWNGAVNAVHATCWFRWAPTAMDIVDITLSVMSSSNLMPVGSHGARGHCGRGGSVGAGDHHDWAGERFHCELVRRVSLCVLSFLEQPRLPETTIWFYCGYLNRDRVHDARALMFLLWRATSISECRLQHCARSALKPVATQKTTGRCASGSPSRTTSRTCSEWARTIHSRLRQGYDDSTGTSNGRCSTQPKSHDSGEQGVRSAGWQCPLASHQ